MVRMRFSQNVYGYLTVFVKESYMSGWVCIAMQSVHIRMNSSLSPPPLKNPGSAYVSQNLFILANSE